MSTSNSAEETPALTVTKAVMVMQLFDDLTMETYYGNNFKSALYECSDEFLNTLRQFVDQCKSDRTKNELPAATE